MTKTTNNNLNLHITQLLLLTKTSNPIKFLSTSDYLPKFDFNTINYINNLKKSKITEIIYSNNNVNFKKNLTQNNYVLPFLNKNYQQNSLKVIKNTKESTYILNSNLNVLET